MRSIKFEINDFISNGNRCGIKIIFVILFGCFLLNGCDSKPSGISSSQPVIDKPRDYEEYKFVLATRLNNYRLQHNLTPLVSSDELGMVAQFHAEDMLNRLYFTHVSPEGEGSTERVLRIAPNLIVLDIRENLHELSVGEFEQVALRVEDAMTSWIDSEGHHQTMINPRSNQIGTGVAWSFEGRDFHQMTAQLFGIVVGSWISTPPVEFNKEAFWVGRLEIPTQFYIQDHTHPEKNYLDPRDQTRTWRGGFPPEIQYQGNDFQIAIPSLDYGIYSINGKLPDDDGFYIVRRFVVR